jgi:hypothetical protein
MRTLLGVVVRPGVDPKPGIALGQIARLRFTFLNVWAKVVAPTSRWKVSTALLWLYD